MAMMATEEAVLSRMAAAALMGGQTGVQAARVRWMSQVGKREC
jgi:putative N-acetylmannosamine-6-phosphate epimerase